MVLGGDSLPEKNLLYYGDNLDVMRRYVEDVGRQRAQSATLRLKPRW